jgi:hypothetical protein
MSDFWNKIFKRVMILAIIIGFIIGVSWLLGGFG